MKGVILFAILCFVTYSRAAVRCKCAGFFHGYETQNKTLYQVSINDAVDCADCKKKCNDALLKVIGGGDLDHITPTHESVKQIACAAFKDDIKNGKLCGYYKCNDGAWLQTSCAKGDVCCVNGRVCARP